MAKRYRVTRGCTFCGMCVVACPEQAIEITDEGAQIDPALCRGCGLCQDNCASEAIVEFDTEESQEETS